MGADLTNDDLYEAARQVLPGGNTRSTLYVPPSPPYAVRGFGCRVVDADGHEVIDANNNYTSLIHGHGFAPVTEAVLATLPDGTAFGLPTRHEVELAGVLAQRVPAGQRWRFSNSGTEAVMQALRIARAATGRSKIIRFAGSYHGTTDAVVDTSAPGVPDEIGDVVIVVPVGDAEAFEAAMDQHGEQVAAVLVDLMPNRAGLTPLQPAFVELLRARASAAGALLIIDEIITFRLAAGGMHSTYDVQPDLVTLGKIIGGGFPVGAVGGSADVMAVIDPTDPSPVSWGGTFSANPITMRAGIAALQHYGAAEVDRLNAAGDRLRERLTDAGVRAAGRGSLIRVFADDSAGLWWSAYREGVLLGTNGLLALSTAMSEDDLELLAQRLINAA